MSEAVTAAKQAEMRLKNAQAELKEKEKCGKSSEQSYNKDKMVYEAARKEVDRIEVRLDFSFSCHLPLHSNIYPVMHVFTMNVMGSQQYGL